MKATLDALDERLRRLLAQPCGRAARIACAALVLLGFAGVMMTRSLALGHHAATAVMMCLPLAAMLVFAMRIAREHEQGALGALLLGFMGWLSPWRGWYWAAALFCAVMAAATAIASFKERRQDPA